MYFWISSCNSNIGIGSGYIELHLKLHQATWKVFQVTHVSYCPNTILTHAFYLPICFHRREGWFILWRKYYFRCLWSSFILVQNNNSDDLSWQSIVRGGLVYWLFEIRVRKLQLLKRKKKKNKTPKHKKSYFSPCLSLCEKIGKNIWSYLWIQRCKLKIPPLAHYTY